MMEFPELKPETTEWLDEDTNTLTQGSRMSNFDFTTEDLDSIIHKIFEDLSNSLKNLEVKESILHDILQRLWVIIINAQLDAKQAFLLAKKLLNFTIHRNCSVPIIKKAICLINQLMVVHHDVLSCFEDKRLKPSVEALGKRIIDAGDYECQILILELMFKLLNDTSRDQMSGLWFPSPELKSDFMVLKLEQFESECRTFLNRLNSSEFGGKVYSFIASEVYLDGAKIEKPYGLDFWVDFNYSSRSISFNCSNINDDAEYDSSQATLETVVISSDLVTSCVINVGQGKCELEIEIISNRPCSELLSQQNSSNVMAGDGNVKIYFWEFLDIQPHLEYVFGESFIGIQVLNSQPTKKSKGRSRKVSKAAQFEISTEMNEVFQKEPLPTGELTPKKQDASISKKEQHHRKTSKVVVGEIISDENYSTNPCITVENEKKSAGHNKKVSRASSIHEMMSDRERLTDNRQIKLPNTMPRTSRKVSRTSTCEGVVFGNRIKKASDTRCLENKSVPKRKVSKSSMHETEDLEKDDHPIVVEMLPADGEEKTQLSRKASVSSVLAREVMQSEECDKGNSIAIEAYLIVEENATACKKKVSKYFVHEKEGIEPVKGNAKGAVDSCIDTDTSTSIGEKHLLARKVSKTSMHEEMSSRDVKSHVDNAVKTSIEDKNLADKNEKVSAVKTKFLRSCQNEGEVVEEIYLSDDENIVASSLPHNQKKTSSNKRKALKSSMNTVESKSDADGVKVNKSVRKVRSTKRIFDSDTENVDDDICDKENRRKSSKATTDELKRKVGESVSQNGEDEQCEVFNEIGHGLEENISLNDSISLYEKKMLRKVSSMNSKNKQNHAVEDSNMLQSTEEKRDKCADIENEDHDVNHDSPIPDAEDRFLQSKRERYNFRTKSRNNSSSGEDEQLILQSKTASEKHNNSVPYMIDPEADDCDTLYDIVSDLYANDLIDVQNPEDETLHKTSSMKRGENKFVSPGLEYVRNSDSMEKLRRDRRESPSDINDLINQISPILDIHEENNQRRSFNLSKSRKKLIESLDIETEDPLPIPEDSATPEFVCETDFIERDHREPTLELERLINQISPIVDPYRNTVDQSQSRLKLIHIPSNVPRKSPVVPEDSASIVSSEKSSKAATKRKRLFNPYKLPVFNLRNDKPRKSILKQKSDVQGLPENIQKKNMRTQSENGIETEDVQYPSDSAPGWEDADNQTGKALGTINGTLKSKDATLSQGGGSSGNISSKTVPKKTVLYHSYFLPPSQFFHSNLRELSQKSITGMPWSEKKRHEEKNIEDADQASVKKMAAMKRKLDMEKDDEFVATTRSGKRARKAAVIAGEKNKNLCDTYLRNSTGDVSHEDSEESFSRHKEARKKSLCYYPTKPAQKNQKEKLKTDTGSGGGSECSWLLKGPKLFESPRKDYSHLKKRKVKTHNRIPISLNFFSNNKTTTKKTRVRRKSKKVSEKRKTKEVDWSDIEKHEFVVEKVNNYHCNETLKMLDDVIENISDTSLKNRPKSPRGLNLRNTENKGREFNTPKGTKAGNVGVYDISRTPSPIRSFAKPLNGGSGNKETSKTPFSSTRRNSAEILDVDQIFEEIPKKSTSKNRDSRSKSKNLPKAVRSTAPIKPDIEILQTVQKPVIKNIFSGSRKEKNKPLASSNKKVQPEIIETSPIECGAILSDIGSIGGSIEEPDLIDLPVDSGFAEMSQKNETTKTLEVRNKEKIKTSLGSVRKSKSFEISPPVDHHSENEKEIVKSHETSSKAKNKKKIRTSLSSIRKGIPEEDLITSPVKHTRETVDEIPEKYKAVKTSNAKNKEKVKTLLGSIRKSRPEVDLTASPSNRDSGIAIEMSGTHKSSKTSKAKSKGNTNNSPDLIRRCTSETDFITPMFDDEIDLEMTERHENVKTKSKEKLTAFGSNGRSKSKTDLISPPNDYDSENSGDLSFRHETKKTKSKETVQTSLSSNRKGLPEAIPSFLNNEEPEDISQNYGSNKTSSCRTEEKKTSLNSKERGQEAAIKSPIFYYDDEIPDNESHHNSKTLSNSVNRDKCALLLGLKRRKTTENQGVKTHAKRNSTERKNKLSVSRVDAIPYAGGNQGLSNWNVTERQNLSPKDVQFDSGIQDTYMSLVDEADGKKKHLERYLKDVSETNGIEEQNQPEDLNSDVSLSSTQSDVGSKKRKISEVLDDEIPTEIRSITSQSPFYGPIEKNLENDLEEPSLKSGHGSELISEDKNSNSPTSKTPSPYTDDSSLEKASECFPLSANRTFDNAFEASVFCTVRNEVKQISRRLFDTIQKFSNNIFEKLISKRENLIAAAEALSKWSEVVIDKPDLPQSHKTHRAHLQNSLKKMECVAADYFKAEKKCNKLMKNVQKKATNKYVHHMKMMKQKAEKAMENRLLLKLKKFLGGF